MKSYTDQEIINGIAHDDRKVFVYIYNRFFPMIDRMVFNLGGKHEDAEDIFQETILTVCRKIKSGELRLCCKFSTYIYAVGKKLWLQQLKSAAMKNVQHEMPVDVVCEPGPEKTEELPFHGLLDKHLKNLSMDCQKILRLHFNRATIEEIMKIMNYTNAHYTMDRKYRCKQSLVKRIINDPDFKALNDELSREDRKIY